MAETALTVQVAKLPFAVISAGNLDFTLAAGDAANGNKFACTGKEILIAYNSDGVNPYTITINSVADEKGRSGSITAYSLAAGDYIIWTGGLTNSKGWRQTDGTITLSVENAAITLAAIRLP